MGNPENRVILPHHFWCHIDGSRAIFYIYMRILFNGRIPREMAKRCVVVGSHTTWVLNSSINFLGICDLSLYLKVCTKIQIFLLLIIQLFMVFTIIYLKTFKYFTPRRIKRKIDDDLTQFCKSLLRILTFYWHNLVIWYN